MFIARHVAYKNLQAPAGRHFVARIYFDRLKEIPFPVLAIGPCRSSGAGFATPLACDRRCAVPQKADRRHASPSLGCGDETDR